MKNARFAHPINFGIRRILFALGLSVGFIPLAAQITFTPLGDLSGGLFSSGAQGVSADGSVVVGYASTNVGFAGFRWTSGTGMVNLGDLPGGNVTSVMYGVSADGSTAVGFGSAPGGFEPPVQWTSGTGMTPLNGVGGGSGSGTTAYGTSADGSVIVGIGRNGAAEQAFRWTANDVVWMTNLFGGAFSTYAYAVSADGSVVVGMAGANVGLQAFRWTSATGMVGLGDLPGWNVNSAAYGVSADGATVVGRGLSALGYEAFRWTSATGMIGLGDLPGGVYESIARATSGDGSIVVGQANAAQSNGNAFIWDETHGMRNLQSVLVDAGANLNGWTLTDATAISADGRNIVGSGINPQGGREAWLVRLPAAPGAVPEPSTYGALGGGVLLLLAVYRRWKVGK